jgi:pyruvate/2-oxoglutarate dehydrogenase complex dihydrolipoamide dehydrogenase (E3) component
MDDVRDDDVRNYDVIVLGGGSTGENAAWYASVNGLRAVVVESELVGGECSYWACMPSKALLRPGEVLAAARRVPAARAGVGQVDVERALATRDAFASGWDDAPQASWLAGVDVDLVRGHGRLTGDRAVVVDTRDGQRVRLTAGRAVVVATGSTAAIPPIEGLRDIDVWDNRGVTSAKAIPRRDTWPSCGSPPCCATGSPSPPPGPPVPSPNSAPTRCAPCCTAWTSTATSTRRSTTSCAASPS